MSRLRPAQLLLWCGSRQALKKMSSALVAWIYSIKGGKLKEVIAVKVVSYVSVTGL